MAAPLPAIQEFLHQVQTSPSSPYGDQLQKLSGVLRPLAKTVPDPSSADLLLDSIPSNCFYSSRLKLELANLLQRPLPVLEAFRSENKVLIERALQFKWIYTGPHSILTLNGSNDLVSNVFPTISYSCRKRVINRLSKYCKDEQKLETIYKSIEERYGLATTIKLLPACGQSFIQPILMDEKKVQLSQRQLEQILKRYPQLALQYLRKYYDRLLKERESNKYLTSGSYLPILSQIVKLEPEAFMDLYETYGELISGFRMGARLTRNFLKSEQNLQRMMSQSNKYSRILHRQKVMRRLDSEQFLQFFQSLLPASITNFQPLFEIGRQGGEKDSLYFWLEKFPKPERFQRLDQAFQKTYGKGLTDFPEFMTSRMIGLLPVSERNKWIDLRLQGPDSQYLYQMFGNVPSHPQGFWEAFRETSESIPRLKQFLQQEPDMHRRAELLSMLVFSCHLNEDLKALEEVIQFVASRFRNDHIQVRSEFLEALVTRFDLLKLSEGHWNGINDLLQISSINNEFSQVIHCVVRILQKSIEWRLLRKLPVDAQIQHYVKLHTRTYCWGESWSILREKPELEKECLRLFVEHVAQLYPSSGSNFNSGFTSAVISMAESISGWNRRRRKDPLSISDFPWLAGKIQEVMDGGTGTSGGQILDRHKLGLVHVVKQDRKLREKYFPDLVKTMPVPPVLEYFLKVKPEVILENGEQILNFMLRSLSFKSYSEFLWKVRSEGHGKIAEELVKYAEVLLKDEEEVPRERANAIKLCSILMPPHRFLQLAKDYFPEESKLDLTADGVEIKFELQKAVAGSLRNIQKPSEGLPVLLEFCRGDYLKLSLGSLYSLSYNAAETEVVEFLRNLVNRPVSVKKHAIRLMTTISNKETITSFLQNLLEAEKEASGNHTIRNLIFQQIFQLFLYESSEPNWKLLEGAIRTLSLSDQGVLNSLGSLHSVEHIPDKWLPRYFQTCWDVVESLELGSGGLTPEIKWALARLIQAMAPDRIGLLEPEFLRNILEKYLFVIHLDQNLESGVAYLAVKYLLYHTQKEAKVDLILTCARKRLIETEQWDRPDENIITLYPCKQALSSFIEQLCIESFKCPNGKLRDEAQAKELMSELSRKLAEVVNPSEIFTDSLFLRLGMIFHSEASGRTCKEDLIQIGKEVGKLADELVASYRPEVIAVFSETLKRFVSLCYKFRLLESEGNGGRIIHVVDGILHSSGSIDTQIIAAQFLSSTYPKPHVLEDEYKRLVEELRTIEDKTVKIFVNYKLTQSRPIGYFDMLV